MSSIPFVIARNTFKEIIRDRILYVIFVFALLLVGVSLALGQLSFREQIKISLDFGFMGIHLSAVVLSIFVGSTLVSKEIEKQTILTLLAHPVSRGQFLFGKFLGLSAVISLVVSCFGLVLLLVALFIGFEVQLSFFIALYGIFLESLVLLSITLLFGTFSKPTLTVVMSAGLFLVGHWLADLSYFSAKSDSSLFRIVGIVFSRALPNLEAFNWRALPVYQDPINWTRIGISTMLALSWALVIGFLANLIFRKRDFV